MAQQDVIKYLLKLEDQMSDGMQLTAQRADELEDKLEQLTKANSQGASEDKKRRCRPRMEKTKSFFQQLFYGEHQWRRLLGKPPQRTTRFTRKD